MLGDVADHRDDVAQRRVVARILAYGLTDGRQGESARSTAHCAKFTGSVGDAASGAETSGTPESRRLTSGSGSPHARNVSNGT
jgi:hypothetical protein